MLENFRIEKECLCMFLRKSTRLQIKWCISSKPMNLAWMTSLDIVSRHFKFRCCRYPCSRPEEYIGLIDTRRNMSIWSINLRHSFDGYMRIIFRYSEECEITFYIIPANIGYYMKFCICMSNNTRSRKSGVCRYVDLSRKFPSLFWNKAIEDGYIFFNYDIDMRLFASVKDNGICIDANICCIKWDFLHEKSIENIWENAISFFW